MSTIKITDERYCKRVRLGELNFGDLFLDHVGVLRQMRSCGNQMRTCGNQKCLAEVLRNPTLNSVMDENEIVTPVNVEICIVD